MHYVYIIQSQTSGRFYIGSTKDLKDRVKGHNSGKTPYTRNKGPWKLVYREEYPTRIDAIKRENAIKMRKSRGFIEKLIDGFSK